MQLMRQDHEICLKILGESGQLVRFVVAGAQQRRDFSEFVSKTGQFPVQSLQLIR